MPNLTDRDWQTALGMLSGGKPHGHSIRRNMLGKGTYFVRPNYLFLLYITAPGGVLKAKIKEGTIANANDPRPEEISFVQDIIGGGGTSIPLTLLEFKKKPCYFTVVIDQPGWDFYYPDPANPDPAWPESHDPLLFLEEKSAVKEVDGEWIRVYHSYAKNRSFYNAEYSPITGKPSVRCINFMTKNDDGDILGPNKFQKFSFNIILRVPISLLDETDTRKITIIIDPDGQNQGPDTV